MSLLTRNRPGAHERWLMDLAAKLTARGVQVNACHLGDRPGPELIAAFAWAEGGIHDHALPVFLRPFLRRPLEPAPVGATTGQLSLLERIAS